MFRNAAISLRPFPLHVLRLANCPRTPRHPLMPLQKVAEFLHRVVQISLLTQKEAGSKKLADFVKAYEQGTGEAPKLIKELKEDVMKFATSFPLPGVLDTVSRRGRGVAVGLGVSSWTKFAAFRACGKGGNGSHHVIRDRLHDPPCHPRHSPAAHDLPTSNDEAVCCRFNRGITDSSQSSIKRPEGVNV
jgi:hypothetical protein